MPFRTLRSRLIAGLVTLLAIACAAVGVVTYFAVQRSLADDLRNQLQAATNTVNNCLDYQLGDNDGDHDQPAGPVPGGSRSDPMYCGGPGTFVAYFRNGQWTAFRVLPATSLVRLTAADKRALSSIAPSPLKLATFPSTSQYLQSMGGSYEITAVADPNGTYVTGLSLDSMHDTLRDVALAEAAVFGGVLLLAGVLGTMWVRLSLRPLRRVAATASQVAELPLESGEVELPAGVPDTDPATETGQVGLAFNRMLGHVQWALARRAASEARLRRFAADASHELRTPLAAIRGYAELALRHPGESPQAVTHSLSRVLSESTRMSVLVDDLLLLARLDAGRPLSREPVDMSRLAIDATSDSRVARPDHRWVLELPDDPVLVNGDELRLHQVLTNLLGNAGRHTPKGTTVTVRLSADAELPQGTPGTDSVLHGVVPSVPRMVLTVTDNGPGIPPDLLPDLFERFTRADTSRSHVADASSTGLGLAIVDAVVAAHHGAIMVTSRPGLTRFAIALPRIAEPAAGPNPAESRRTRRSLHRLLG
jgi:two-component system OmpR family sensor kinase